MLDEFMKNVNKIVQTEHGKEVKPENFLLEAELDSFAWLMFWLELGNIYPDAFSEKYVQELNYNTTKFIDLYKKIGAKGE